VAPEIREYSLTINNIVNTPFWAQPDGRSNTFQSYVFSAKSLTDKCDIEICKPELSNNSEFPGISGSAVIFRGDLYNNDYTVQSSPPDPSAYNSDVFNIACFGTTLSKLHFLRHTSASARPAGANIPTIPQRQTLLKLLAADYCGNGIPFTSDGISFTINGLPIALEFANSYYKLTNESGYIGQPSSIDALWNGNGATCIDNPRLENAIEKQTVTGIGPNRATIQATCESAGHPIPTCTSPVSLMNPFAMGNYAISKNP